MWALGHLQGWGSGDGLVMLAGECGTPEQGVTGDIIAPAVYRRLAPGPDCLQYPQCAEEDGYLPVRQRVYLPMFTQ